MVAFDGRSHIHLSACAILGVTLRVLLDLWFQPNITNNGRTNEHGGAMFADLPANMVGSFLVGMLSISFINKRFQKHILLAWKTGFCGSLTTFASWNTQMVVMMEGSINTYHQSQIGSAIFGYLIGFQLALASFRTGKHFALYLQHYNDNKSASTIGNNEQTIYKGDEENTVLFTSSPQIQQDQTFQQSSTINETLKNENNTPEQTNTNASDNKCKILEIILNNISIVLSMALIIAFIYLDVKNLRINSPIQRNLFYQKMWLSFLFAPLGAILRWKLSTYNTSGKSATQIRKENDMQKNLCHNLPSWFPYGTFYANILGSIISILAVGFLDRFSLIKNSSELTILSGINESLLETCLGAIKTGFAGCLSTVSTFISEVDGLFEKYPKEPKGYIYGLLSICFACIISLCIYVPLLRAL